jgi:hypothetical protein
MMTTQRKYKLIDAQRADFVSVFKDTSEPSSAAATEAAVNSENAAQTEATHKSLSDTFTSILKRIGATQVGVGQGQHRCVRVARRFRVNRNPELQILNYK